HVAEQRVLDEYRRMHSKKRDRTRQRPLVTDNQSSEFEIPVASPDPTPSQLAQARETHELLMSELDEEKRMIINLRCDGFSNAEVADQTGWHVRRVQRF